MPTIHVGVLRGGPSSEYDISLKTGESVLKHIPKKKYVPHDILISKEGDWYLKGLKKNPHDIVRHIDVVWNALHGAYGEDGKIQKELGKLLTPYTGSGTWASALAMNKGLTKDYLKDVEGVKFARHKIVSIKDEPKRTVQEIFNTFPFPFIIKPLSGGSSVDTILARSWDDIVRGMNKAFENHPRVLVEEYIKGREATCGIIENFRGEKYYALPPVEIRPKNKNSFFDYDAKYGGTTDEICPGNFSSEEKRMIMDISKTIHQQLGLRHYSRADFIISPRGIYFLEVNTLPGLTEESLFPKALNAVGSNLSEFLDHVTDLALK